MTSMSHTWVKNPATNGIPWECPNDALDRHLRSGWERCEAPAEDESHLRDPEPVKPPVKKAESPKKSGD